MGPENKIDLGDCTLCLNGEPIAWGQGELPEITVPKEVREPASGLPFEYMECTLYFKIPKRWRCKSRKRFIKLMMSEGISRNNAERIVDFTRGLMSYREAWSNYLLHRAWKVQEYDNRID